MENQNEKIVERATEGIIQMHQPACPKCRHEPLEFSCNVCRTGAGHLVAVIWCGACGHTLNVQFVGMDQPQQGPRIVRPS